jgi:hypothetical protein
VYVVVAVIVGATFEPDARPSEVTSPTLLSMTNEVACAVVQERVGAPLATKVVGFAESVQTGGAIGVVTVTVAAQCAVPPAPVTVPVYVVVVVIVGATFEPEARPRDVTSPTLLSMTSDVAF